VHLDDRPADLAVIAVDAGVLERIPHALLKVVPVATAAIGGIQMQFHLERNRERLLNPPCQERADRVAVLPPLAAEAAAADRSARRQLIARCSHRSCPRRNNPAVPVR
jgi:hypothetical protein